MKNLAAKFAFFICAAITIISALERVEWTRSRWEPQQDLPILILLGILAHFAFDRKPAPSEA